MTFEHEITYLEVIPEFKEGGEPDYKRQTVKKTIRFQELDQCDRDQHKVHFLIMGYYMGEGMTPKKKRQVVIDPEFAMELAQTYLTEMTVISKEFTATDRELALNDSGCLLKLALWLIPKKVLPFFLELTKSMVA